MSELPIHLFNIKLIDSQSMGSDITSSSLNINTVVSYSIHAVWSDGNLPVGEIIIQGANTDDDSSYVDITSDAVSGNSGASLFNIEKPAYAYVRVFYNRTSGTGTLNVWVNAKRG